MNKQNKNDQDSSSQREGKNAGGIDDIEEGDQRMDADDGQPAPASRRAEDEKRSYPDNRSGSERKR